MQTLLHNFLFEIVIFWIRIFKCQKHETSFWFWLAGEIFFLMLNANERTSRHPLYPSAQSPFTFSLFLFFTAIVSSLLSFLSHFFLYLSSLSYFLSVAILILFYSLIMNFQCHIFSLYVYLLSFSLSKCKPLWRGEAVCVGLREKKLFHILLVTNWLRWIKKFARKIT